MCGRFTITSPPAALRDLFGYDEQPNFPPRYNIAPTQPVPVILFEGGRRRFLLVRWGLVPSWAKAFPGEVEAGSPSGNATKQRKPQSVLINARAETIDEKPSFRGAFRHHRALMPADGFYEWRTTGSGPKQPFLIRRRAEKNGDRAPFAIAALWDTWMDSHGSEIDSCALVTTEANETLAPIHHRMPVILAEKDWNLWLDPSATEKELKALLRPAPDDLLEAIPVSTRINSVANDDPSVQTREEIDPAPEKPARRKPPEPDTRQMGLF